jgi:hypothetical protein
MNVSIIYERIVYACIILLNAVHGTSARQFLYFSGPQPFCAYGHIWEFMREWRAPTN